nr:hypothetical protein BaRGS_004123 [Batillaria attramentaria]
MCACMMAAFFVCFMPYIVLSLVSAAGYELDIQISTLPTMFSRLSCATNPVIYVFMSSKFRTYIRTHPTREISWKT